MLEKFPKLIHIQININNLKKTSIKSNAKTSIENLKGWIWFMQSNIGNH